MKAVTVSPASAIQPGHMQAFEIEGTRVAVANVDGRFYAFADTCTHEECSLADGILDGVIVMCPCHSAEFDVTDGSVVSPPAPAPVTSYPVHVRDGQIIVEI